MPHVWPHYSAVYKTTFYRGNKRHTVHQPNVHPVFAHRINSPGAGSDYGTFQQRAGITCADFRYDQDYVSTDTKS